MKLGVKINKALSLDIYYETPGVKINKAVSLDRYYETRCINQNVLSLDIYETGVKINKALFPWRI